MTQYSVVPRDRESHWKGVHGERKTKIWHKKENDFIQLREEVTHDPIFCSPEKESHWKGVLGDPKTKMWHEKERDFIQLRKEVTKKKFTPIALGFGLDHFKVIPV